MLRRHGGANTRDGCRLGAARCRARPERGEAPPRPGGALAVLMF